MARKFHLAFAILAMVGACGACCCGAQPENVRASLRHAILDLESTERDLLPLVPEAATADFGGGPRPAREVWRVRLRGMMLRLEGLSAWAEDKPFDDKEAVKRLFGGAP